MRAARLMKVVVPWIQKKHLHQTLGKVNRSKVKRPRGCNGGVQSRMPMDAVGERGRGWCHQNNEFPNSSLEKRYSMKC